MLPSKKSCRKNAKLNGDWAENALVVGASGFIGRPLTNWLAAAGPEICARCRNPPACGTGPIVWLRGDVSEPSSVREIFPQFHPAVVACARQLDREHLLEIGEGARGKVPTRVANAELARRLIGFEASTRLPEGISRTIDAVGCLHNLAAPAC